jgi:hypothetical protein
VGSLRVTARASPSSGPESPNARVTAPAFERYQRGKERTMPEFFMRGGWIMWFLLLIGAWGVVAAGGFAVKPGAAKLERVRCLSRAVAWGVVTGVATDLAAVGIQIPNRAEWANSPTVHLLILEGFGESMSPAILGGALLSAIALVTAIGHSRATTLT